MLAHRYAQVLVHGNQPIDGLGFFKQGALHGDMACREHFGQGIVGEESPCQFGAPRLRKQCTRAGTVDCRKLPDQFRTLGCIKQARHDFKPVQLERIQGLA